MKFLKIISEKITMKDSIKMEVKRGEKSQEYFWLAFFFLATFFATIISILELDVLPKIALIIFFTICFFYFCLHNNWVRNQIVGILNKVSSKLENFHQDKLERIINIL